MKKLPKYPDVLSKAMADPTWRTASSEKKLDWLVPHLIQLLGARDRLVALDKKASAAILSRPDIAGVKTALRKDIRRHQDLIAYYAKKAGWKRECQS